MRVIEARNVHDALPKALALLRKEGVPSESRNGPVLVTPTPVTTIYSKPMERVLFHPERDANPFFHLYESLWMLMGRNDVTPLVRYAKQMAEYSDDGETLHSAYGYRWRKHFHHNTSTPYGLTGYDIDQLHIIAERLTNDPTDRRSVLQIWSAPDDLGSQSKDLPCNLIATFQRQPGSGALDLTVFNRSNDIIWGAYGANAVQFSTLQEFVAMWIGCPVGTYRQVSVNWHGYLKTLEGMEIPIDESKNPYTLGQVKSLPLSPIKGLPAITYFQEAVQQLFVEAEHGFHRMYKPTKLPFINMAYHVLYAHEVWRTKAAPERYDMALDALSREDTTVDWIVACSQWIARRRAIWEAKVSNAAAS